MTTVNTADTIRSASTKPVTPRSMPMISAKRVSSVAAERLVVRATNVVG